MRTFDVLKDENGNYRAVKVGFSWPACLCNWIWAAYCKLWDLTVSLLVIGGGLRLLGNFAKKLPDPSVTMGLQLITLLLSIGMYLYVGTRGNKWLKRKFLNDGYSELGTVEAESKQAAIAKFS